MLIIKFNGETYNIKNSIKELNIDEFENIFMIFNNKDNIIDKWFSILRYLGLTEEIINNISLDEFKDIIHQFDFNTCKNDIQKYIYLNGEEYSSFDDKFILTVKNVLLIEDYITINPNKYLAEVIAILYTNDTEKELTHKQIKDKAELIRKQVNCEVGIPIINLLRITFFSNIKTNE